MDVFGGVASPLTWGRAAALLMCGAASVFTTFSTPSTVTMQCYADDTIVLARDDKDTRRKLLECSDVGA